MLRPDVESYNDFTIVMTRTKGDAFRAQIRIGSGEQYEVVFRLPISEDDVARSLASVPAAARVYAQRASSYDSIDPMRRIGGILFSSLFEGRSRSLYSRAREQAESDGMGLRLRIVPSESYLAAMPWEFLHDGQDFISLSLGTPIVRSAAIHLAIPRPLVATPRLLLLVHDTSDNRRGLEPIAEDVQGLSKAFPQLQIAMHRGGTARQLEDAIQAEPYEFLFFVGAGFDGPDGNQGLLLVEQGKPEGDWGKISAGALRDVLERQTNLRMVYLCAGRTDRIAQTLAAVCPAAAGISGEMEIPAAGAFSHGLMHSLLAGMPLEAAFTRGRQQVDAENPGSREWGLPVLYTQTEPGTPLVARQPVAESIGEPAGTQTTPRRQRLTAREAERKVLDSRLTMLTLNLDEIEKKEAATPGPMQVSSAEQKKQLTQEIAEVKSKLSQIG